MKLLTIRVEHTLDVVTKDLAMTLRAALSKTFSTFSASRHDSSWLLRWVKSVSVAVVVVCLRASGRSRKR